MSEACRTYRAFGLTIGSELPLPLPETPRATPEPDLNVRRGDVNPSDDDSGVYLELAGISARLRDSTTFIVDPGQQGVQMASLVLLKRYLPALQFQRGSTLLHAGAVSIDGRGVAFAGHRESGKSSLVGTMYERGHRIITDDILMLADRDGSLVAVPSFPRISLTPQSRDMIDVGLEAVLSPKYDGSKPWYAVDDGFGPNPVPIDVVYLLGERGEVASPEIHPVGGRAALEAVAQHSVRFHWLNTADPVTRQFRQCVSLCTRTEVKSLRRPDGFGTIPDVIELVENDVRSPRP